MDWFRWFLKFVTNAVGLLIIGAIGFLAWTFYQGSKPGFTDAELSRLKSSIREEYQKNEKTRVIDVVMLRETDTRAVGFVKINLPALGEITRACSATMDANGRDYFWRCQ